MHLSVLVPGLIWPEPEEAAALADLACPGLTALLARSRLTRLPPQAFEVVLGSAFGLAADAAFAALRLCGENSGPATGDACWLCADPVHLRLHNERLVLAAGDSLAIEASEAEAIAGELNRHFDGVATLHVAAADRWYLELARGRDAGAVDSVPLSAAAGRRIDRQLPETSEARWLRRWLNEAQMILHQHPANQQREDDGRPTINSLWLWGGGVLPARARSHFAGVWCDNTLARGVARAFSAPVQPLPADAAALLATARQGEHLVVLDGLLASVQYEDAAAYRNALGELEARWFAPLRAALARGRVKRLRLQAATAYGACTWESTRSDQWKVWQRPVTLTAVAQSLAGNDA